MIPRLFEWLERLEWLIGLIIVLIFIIIFIPFLLAFACFGFFILVFFWVISVFVGVIWKIRSWGNRS